VRTYATQAPYDPTPSAQIRTKIRLHPQVTALQGRLTRNGDKSQGNSSGIVLREFTELKPVVRLGP